MSLGSRRYLYYALTFYGVAVSVTAQASGHRDALLALPLLGLSIVPTVTSSLGDVLLHSAAIYLAAAAGPSAAPMLVLSPLVFRPASFRAWRSRIILGPSTRRFILYTLAASVACLIYPYLFIYILLTIMAGITYAIMSYSKLKAVELQISHAPTLAALESSSTLVLQVSSREPVWVELYTSNGGKITQAIQGGGNSIRVPLDTSQVGKHTITVEAYVIDKWGLAQRRALEAIIEYRVVPQLRIAVRHYLGELSSWSGTVEGRGLEIGLYIGASGAGRNLHRLQLVRLLRQLTGGAQKEEGPADMISFIAAGVARHIVYSSAMLSHGRRRGRLGEYASARLYVPGDDIRAIHWKKSLKLQELVVKEYAADELSSRGAGRGKEEQQFILVADLAASSPRDFDRVLRSTIENIAEYAAASPSAEMVMLLHYGGKYLVLRGEAAEVLEALGRTLESYDIFSYYYNYDSVAEPLDTSISARIVAAKPDELPATVRSIVEYVDSIISLLRLWGAKNGARLVLVHSRATSTRNSVLEHVLKELLGLSVNRINL